MSRAFFRRRKSCPFSGKNAPKIDFKDVRLLLEVLDGPVDRQPDRGSDDVADRDVRHDEHEAAPDPTVAGTLDDLGEPDTVASPA